MNIILKTTILQFLLLTADCQMEDEPHCDFEHRPQELRFDLHGNPYHVNVRTMICSSGSLIYEGFFVQWRDSNYDTDIIYFANSYFHTIPALTFHELPDLKQIYLNDTSITTLEVGCFLGVKDLQILRLDGNNIEDIDKGIVNNLPSLITLRLSNNQLRAIHSGSFNGLRNLEGLFLEGNKLHFLPDDLFSPLSKIKTIDLSRNYLEALNSDIFYHLSELEYLYVNNNRLKHLPSYLFKDLPKLILLDISENYLANISSDLFPGLDSLTHLNVSHNQLTTLKANDVYFLSNLKELKLAYNNISFLNPDELAIFLPNLKEVYVDGNNWTCGMLFNIIKTFRMADVQIKPGKQYQEGNIIGISCSGPSINSSFASFTNGNNGQSTQETDESRYFHYNHILLEIVGKISDNNNLMEQLIHANLNSSKSIQTISENVQKIAINPRSSVTSYLPNQNMSQSVERTNNLLGNILSELRMEWNNIVNIIQTSANRSKVNDDLPRLNSVNPQLPLVDRNVPPSSSNLEMLKFMNNMKTELEISRTILDIFMKNTSQAIASMQAKINEPAVTPQNNKNNQVISERFQRNPSESNTGNGNIAVIVCLCIVVIILIMILVISYVHNKKRPFIANGLRRYSSNRPLGNRSDTDLIANSTTLSNSEV
ncbi:leucine-rich repeat-containing protein 15-like isoform X2 [Agrilus planipennis]|nr:leucine-rich repeat-containing protein 15-like isoform X2 [Agrilus planipennis]XP_025836408.1 leucine-rich repeat-containing protein 15-like isoform X2 [Agrilus planipennis]